MNDNKVTCTIYQTGTASYLFRGWEYAKKKRIFLFSIIVIG